MWKIVIILILFVGELMASEVTIDVYSCYANSHRLVAEGRVLNRKKVVSVQADDSTFRNLKRKISKFFNREKKDILLSVDIADTKYQIQSDDEGYFELDITMPSQVDSKSRIDISLSDDNSTNTTCWPQVPVSHGIGVISDFDDTLIVSDVTNKAKLIDNTFMKNYKQRELIAQTATQIKSILSKQNGSAFFVLSASPDQINQSIHNFLDYHNMPTRSVITKKIQGENSYSLLKQNSYKSEKIQKLIAMYPKIRWTLFGDSGEQDRQIYSEIAQSYPGNIETIYIRNVDNGKLDMIK